MSWNQLKEIIDENRKEARDEKRRGVLSCPIDGSQLDYNPVTGLWNCRMGNYSTRNGPRE